MLAKCANPNCESRFRYMREGKLFTFRGSSTSDQIGKTAATAEHWWLCSPCAATLTIRFDPVSGARVQSQTKLESGLCVRVASLYQPGLVESYCNRCGRFVAASNSARALTVAEETHRCTHLVTSLNLTAKKPPQTNRTLPSPLLLTTG
jgi:hypothetical protein